MKCPRCKKTDVKVVDSRTIKEGAGVRRRRECIDCGYRFTTIEEVLNLELKVVKKNSVREDMNHEKIRRSIQKACWKRPIAPIDIDRVFHNVVSKIESEFEREVSTTEIGNRVMEALKDLDEVAYIRFASVYRKFKDITEFISEIQSSPTPKETK